MQIADVECPATCTNTPPTENIEKSWLDLLKQELKFIRVNIDEFLFGSRAYYGSFSKNVLLEFSISVSIDLSVFYIHYSFFQMNFRVLVPQQIQQTNEKKKKVQLIK